MTIEKHGVRDAETGEVVQAGKVCKSAHFLVAHHDP
jgi:hypothetical protein